MASTDLFTVRVVEIENKSNTNVDNGNDVDSHSEDIHQNNAKPDQVCHQQGLSTIEEHQNLISARVLRGRVVELQYPNLVGQAVKFKKIINYDCGLKSDVLVSDNITVDLVLYRYWLDGYSVNESVAFVRENESDFLKTFNDDLVIADILDQFRTFALIEKLLPCPGKLSEDWTFRMAENTKMTLIEKFYDFDESVMKAILGKKLSARSRRDLDEVSRKSGKSLKSCRRQFDNFKRIYKTIDGLPGNVVTNIQNHFLLSESLAQKYANYMCYNRFEINKRRPFRGWTAVFRN